MIWIFVAALLFCAAIAILGWRVYRLEGDADRLEKRVELSERLLDRRKHEIERMRESVSYLLKERRSDGDTE